MTLTVELVTPERLVFKKEADEVVFTGIEGQIGILPGHIPLISQLMPGPLMIKQGAQTTFYAVSSGLAQVDNNTVKILTQAAESQSEIDVQRAERALSLAEKELKEKSEYDETFADTQASYARALNRMNIGKK